MVSHCGTDWYADRLSDDDRSYLQCPHRQVVVDSSDSRRFVEGEVTDDIMVRALCLDCGEYLTEAAIRGSWDGEPHQMDTNIPLEEEIYEVF